jgi:hypothetical protein
VSGTRRKSRQTEKDNLVGGDCGGLTHPALGIRVHLLLCRFGDAFRAAPFSVGNFAEGRVETEEVPPAIARVTQEHLLRLVAPLAFVARCLDDVRLYILVVARRLGA